MSLKLRIAPLFFLPLVQLSAQYVISTFAGGGTPPPLPATSVGIGRPRHLAADANGNIYIMSDTQNRIFKVDSAGTLTTVAGNGGIPLPTDTQIGPALGTSMYPASIAVDPGGTLYAGGGNCCVFKISNGLITRAAGNGTQGIAGDSGPASNASINPGAGIAFDGMGNLYISDPLYFRIQKISNGIISTVAGNSGKGFSGDGGPATGASLWLNYESALAADNNGNLYIADTGNYRIRKVAKGIITTIAGDGTGGYVVGSPNSIPAAGTPLGSLGDVTVDGLGNLYISDLCCSDSFNIRKLANGLITTISDTLAAWSLAADNTGNLYVADYWKQQVWRISNSTVTTIAGNGDGSFLGDGSAATSADLALPSYVAVDRAGNVFFTDSGNHRIRRVTAGRITTIATSNNRSYACNTCPGALTVDSSGNVYYVDGVQVHVNSNGVNSVVAGNGSSFYSGDGGPATLAGISPQGLAVDSHGDLYIADQMRIRKVSQGVITTVAGNGTQGSCATTSSATGASMNNVVGGLTVDSSGNIYYVNTIENELCKVSNGTVASIANGSTPGFRLPSGVARNETGDFFILAQGGVWKLSNGVLTNIAGTPLPYDLVGYSGEGGPAANAALNTALFSGIDLDVAGNIYIADSGNNRIRVLSPTGSGNPIGSFDTPLDNTIGIAGAIPVTGWALDRVGISKVQVWREPVGNEPVASNHLVYIGDAVQVPGVRPDVQGLYPNMPFNDRAGWGYMLLTNFLPSVSGALGNGTYKLHFIAYNNAGGQTDLGTRSIVVDNVHASKPFGTIDTPGQGDTIEGNAYVNFGWALTQNPYCIPNDGHTLNVFIDGVILGHPTYNQKRSDIATLFPGLCNSNGGVGFFSIDTTKLANGLHNIAWAVTDNQGRGDGIGSRYFTVQNAGGVAAPGDMAPESVKTRTAQTRRGSYAIEVEELDRIELDLGAISSDSLPVGSTLKDGVFYWQLGPGFLGDYEFRFTRADGTRALLHVKVRPKSYARN